ncbi:putative uncharacterized protein DDB_G0271606 isoform X1 [Anopheles gambiae]|uniref:putative uncharacterized protein DDB_G0271606 isoform X1 n=1 Tax=Anopheles gambiae TaxID=7165 RepID=UPI002AC98010|nr:putative uncharacterized protein DDB_G0271606 isoform X1 [Anopheles gambiae]XP_061501480.1 putative uncharacterized protein DDB_G0271606 isoform X1 [Anopheles gambiae]XP_061501481.1 putative uncharacterized protein DDB_G0271606 isoform X1 [Anopheles gambiae]XP_061501482.1 putative uncharacterized protein DDB_G0271606 isoform X1 [Anopheles gambiae]XP_061501483.1 putative uncharacterized protein DDB_G0271606 isoform X1 [Anopheles gambiae]XP_061501484.1 putative uncharacterized protein DDB_G02
MGCGQSKIHLYPRKNKSKSNGKKSGHIEDAEADEEDGQNGRSDERGDRGDRGDLNGEKEKLDEEHSLRDDGSPEPPNGEIVSILRKNGSLLQSQEISSSQQNFFRMLDQKIEEGPDYDSSSETEQALEEARLNALVQHWESASLTTSMCSSTSRSLQGTPVRQVPLRQPPLRPPFQQPLSAELLSQQQLLLKQQHHHLQQQHQQQQHLQQQQQLIQHQQQQLHNLQQQQQQQHGLHQQAQGSQSQQALHHPNLTIGMNSPKRIIASGNAVSMGGGGVDGGPPSQRQLLSQSIIHQNYGVIQPSQTTPQLRPSSGRTLPSPVQCLQMSYYQQQQQQQQQSQQQQQQQAQSLSQQFQQQQSLPPHSTTSYYNDILRHPMQLPPVTQLQQLQSQAQQQPVQQQQQQQSPMPAGISNVSSSVAASLASASVAVASASGPSGGPSGAVGGPLSMSSTEPRFPPAIAVQRLAPQVQRQLRETQELIKDSCVQLYGSAYGTGPGPPTGGGGGSGGGGGGVGVPVGSVLARATARRPTLETQYSQELS